MGSNREVEREQWYGYNEEKNAFWLGLYFATIEQQSSIFEIAERALVIIPGMKAEPPCQ